MTEHPAKSALDRIPGWSANDVETLEKLGGSDTNRCYLVQRNHERYVLRLDTPLAAALGLDRERERLVRERVAAAGLAPAVIHFDPADGILLSEYQDGQTWTKAHLHDASNLDRLAERLKTLHALPPAGEPVNLSATLERYARRVGSARAAAAADQGCRLLGEIGEYTAVLCHNDLVAENMIAGETLWLIDWEYAAPGDPRFDLAVVIEHHDLPASLWRPFVAMCLGNLDDDVERDLARYRAVYRLLVALWTDACEATCADGAATLRPRD